MLKISASELEQALNLIRKTSPDYHVIVSAEPSYLRMSFHSANNEICHISLYDEGTKVTATVSSIESLAQSIRKLKVTP